MCSWRSSSPPRTSAHLRQARVPHGPAAARVHAHGLHVPAHRHAAVHVHLGSGVIGIFLVTALWGRAWCGWACPQTVYLEFLFRPIGAGSTAATPARGPRQAGRLVHAARLGKYITFFAAGAVRVAHHARVLRGHRTAVRVDAQRRRPTIPRRSSSWCCSRASCGSTSRTSASRPASSCAPTGAGSRRSSTGSRRSWPTTTGAVSRAAHARQDA
jgi:hypothetical protein